jgi:hypothetical protein
LSPSIRMATRRSISSIFSCGTWLILAMGELYLNFSDQEDGH